MPFKHFSHPIQLCKKIEKDRDCAIEKPYKGFIEKLVGFNYSE